MTSTIVKKPCVKCPKGHGQVLCDGCLQYFCLKHLNEHRQELSQQMDDLTLEHDELHLLLLDEDKLQQHPLIERINQWESKSIDRIKQTADELKQLLKQSLNELKKQLAKSLRQVTEEIHENRRTESFTEIDLTEWMRQLKQLRENFDNPPMIELRCDEDQTTSTHLPLMQLRTTKQYKVLEQISNETTWSPKGQTIAGGQRPGNAMNQLNSPFGLDIDEDGTVIITDTKNHRILRWKPNAMEGETVVGDKDLEKGTESLTYPLAVLIDRIHHCLIVSEGGNNRRVMQWSLDRDKQMNVKEKVIVSNVDALALALDHDGSLYVSDRVKHEVRRYGLQDGKEGIVVAGGHGQGDGLHQLNSPRHIFVDDDYSVYVSDKENHRVMKWSKNAREGIVVAGGQNQGNSLEQLSSPGGIFIDRNDSVYVVDQDNHRVMRWTKDAKKGEVIVGGNGQGSQNNQFFWPTDISFDNQGNLYVVDRHNHRIQRFNLRSASQMNSDDESTLGDEERTMKEAPVIKEKNSVLSWIRKWK